MPFESYAQAAYLKHKKPKIYKRWKKKYGMPKGVPMHVKGSGKFTMGDIAQGYKKVRAR